MKYITLNTDRNRHAAWLELFFDLVYVVALSRMTHHIIEGHEGNVSTHDYLIFFTLFVPVWWSWVGQTMYQNRFGTYDITDTLLTLLQMFFAILLAYGLSDAFGDTRHVFIVAYAGTRWVLVAMYMRVYLGNPDMRTVTGGLSLGFGIGSSIWLSSIFFEPPVMYGLWITGLAIELATPLILRRQLAKKPVHNTHLPERVGLFALLVLGESFIGLVSGADKYTLTVSIIPNILSAFVIICGIWWIYFETLEKALNGHMKGAAHLCIYGHLPIYMGFGLLAAGIQELVSIEPSSSTLGKIFSFSLLLIFVPLELIHNQYISKNASKLVMARAFLVALPVTALFLSSKFMAPRSIAILTGCMLVLHAVLERISCGKTQST